MSADITVTGMDCCADNSVNVVDSVDFLSAERSRR